MLPLPPDIKKPQPPKGVLERFVSRLVHETILSFLKNITPEDISNFIEADINLIEAFRDLEGHTSVKKIHKLFLKWKRRGEEYLTVDNVLYQAWEHRQDLFVVLNTPKGREFIKKNLINLKTILF